VRAVPELLAKAASTAGTCGRGDRVRRSDRRPSQTVIKSHQIDGWDGFPLADWVSDLVGAPAVLCNDADVAGLAEALFGAGQGLSPIFYITVGTGVGGGLIIDGHIYRGVGRGAAEIGHYIVLEHAGDGGPDLTVESFASGAGIQRLAEKDGLFAGGAPPTVQTVATLARAKDFKANRILDYATASLATAVSQMITLLCPARVVIGGGVSLIGEELFFAPLRRAIAAQTFLPFAGLTDIVPAALGEEVVVHGALALARQKLGG
jgi:glucokinase